MDEFGSTRPEKMPFHFFLRAIALNYATAIRADVEKQNYTTAPRHWYIDAGLVCDACGEVFRFSAAEQRAWYETYRFYVDSFPRRCLGCRRAARHAEDLRQRYGAEPIHPAQAICKGGRLTMALAPASGAAKTPSAE